MTVKIAASACLALLLSNDYPLVHRQVTDSEFNITYHSEIKIINGIKYAENYLVNNTINPLVIEWPAGGIAYGNLHPLRFLSAVYRQYIADPYLLHNATIFLGAAGRTPVNAECYVERGKIKFDIEGLTGEVNCYDEGGLFYTASTSAKFVAELKTSIISFYIPNGESIILPQTLGFFPNKFDSLNNWVFKSSMLDSVSNRYESVNFVRSWIDKIYARATEKGRDQSQRCSIFKNVSGAPAEIVLTRQVRNIDIERIPVILTSAKGEMLIGISMNAYMPG